MVRNLPPESAHHRLDSHGWGPHEENTARLLEASTFELELDWIDRITDPEDKSVIRERAAAKRAGIKPPQHPLIPPTALRPHKIGQQRLQRYLDEVEQYQATRQPKQEMISSAEFDKARGLVAKHQ